MHGDMRETNVMICSATDSVALIDFEWAGIDGIDVYPLLMNTVSISWPEGAAPGNMLRMEHDEYWMRRLFEYN